MAPISVYSVLTANGLLGGVGVWSLRLSEWTARHSPDVRWVTLVVASDYTEDQCGWFLPKQFPHVEYWSYSALDQKPRLLASLVDRLRSADVVVPNYVVAAWDATAVLKRSLGSNAPRVIGVCHSDHELFYGWLRQFGPTLDAAAAVSAHCRAEVERRCALNGLPVEQLPYGVPVPAAVPASSPPPPLRLVYVGRLSEHQKRVSLLVALAEELFRRDCPFELCIYGDGPARVELSRRLANLPCARVLGPVPYGQLGQAFESAHVQLLLSDHEGLPIALLEGMAYGVVPLACSVASGVPELIEPGTTGFLVPVDEPILTAADRLCELVRDPDRWACVSRAARKVVQENYALDDVAPRWIELARAVATRPARTPPATWAPPPATGFGRETLLDRRWVPQPLTRWLRRLRHRR